MNLYTFEIIVPKSEDRITVLSSDVTSAHRIAGRMVSALARVSLVEEEYVENTKEAYLKAVKRVTIPGTSSSPP